MVNNETLYQMAYQLISVDLDILTDRDIDMTNQIVPNVDTFHYYYLNICPLNNQTLNVYISNSTFHNVYLHLDNSTVAAHMNNNVFIGAGIKILSTSTDLHQPVIIQNCIFQGLYSETIFKVLNTANVYLHSSVFNNSKLVLPTVDENEKSGMLGLNSQIELRDIVFRTVSFFPVTAFENCTLAIYQLTMSGHSLYLLLPNTNSLLYLKYSKAVIEDSTFEDNTDVYCRWVHATVNISNTSILNSRNFIFPISQSEVFFSS